MAFRQLTLSSQFWIILVAVEKSGVPIYFPRYVSVKNAIADVKAAEYVP